MTGPDRGTRMSRRIRRTLEEAGLEADGVVRSHEVAMAHRRARLADDHHPHFLHPGRTVLVAVGDAELRDPELLALAPLLDSLHPELAPGGGGVVLPLPLRGLADPDGAPVPDPDTLLESLVTLDAEPLALVLSEALDHLRHLHLSDDPALQRRVALRTEAVLLPLAGRMGGTLDRRYRWWWRRVGRGMA
jgi:hypothetical protein